MELAAEITSDQWINLERFAANRLRRAATSPPRQRALAQFCPRSLLHTALERFATGDAGGAEGRRLQPHQRTDVETFMHALRSAVNSLLADACRRAEVEYEHLLVGSSEFEPGAVEPQAAVNADEELSLRDITSQVFAHLESEAGTNAGQRAAVQALRDNCLTGHAHGDSGVNHKVAHKVRQQAQQLWRELEG